MIKDVLYKEFKIYYKNESNKRLAEIVLDKNYKVIDEYKIQRETMWPKLR